MGPKTKELLMILGEIESILENSTNHDWRKFIATVKSRIENSDYSGVEAVLGAYGGMGSLNDVVVGQKLRGNDIRSNELFIAENERFDFLRAKAYEVARFIRDNHEITEA